MSFFDLSLIMQITDTKKNKIGSIHVSCHVMSCNVTIVIATKNVCSHISVFTWICMHKCLLVHAVAITMVSAYIFEVWKKFRITRMLAKLISVTFKMHSVDHKMYLP